MTRAFEELTRLVEPLFCGEANLHQTLNNLFALFSSLSGLDADREENRQNIVLPSGLALGPTWAAMCLKDIGRTSKLLYGLRQAILDQQKKHPGTPVHVLYCGCGPFATLAIPLMTKFNPEDLQFTLLEVNPSSVEILRRLITALGVTSFIKAIEITDATQYVLPDPSSVHIAIAETMQHALAREPQVGVTLNIARQLSTEAVFIPQHIDVQLGVYNPSLGQKYLTGKGNTMEEAQLILQTLITLNKESIFSLIGPDGCPVFEEKEVEIPVDLPPAFSQLCLFTNIHIYRDFYLKMSDSALSFPLILADLNSISSPLLRVSAKYQMEGEPGFNIGFEWGSE